MIGGVVVIFIAHFFAIEISVPEFDHTSKSGPDVAITGAPAAKD